MSVQQPWDSGCATDSVFAGQDHDSVRLEMILVNSMELFGYDISTMVANTYTQIEHYSLPDPSEYRNPDSPNYIPCEDLGDVITLAKGYKRDAQEDKSDCNGLEFNCKCNANANYASYTEIVQALQTAENWGVGAVEECQEEEAVAAANRIETFVESLWAQSVDVEKDNKRLVVGLIGTSMLMIGGLLLMTKNR